MEYDENDNEIIFMISEPSDEASEYLINKYRWLIEHYVNKYKNIASKIGIEKDDLYQEGLIGFIEAIKKYNEYKDIKFNTYATNMIRNHMLKIIEVGLRSKNKVLNEALSLEYDYSNNNNLGNYIGENNLIDKVILKDQINDIKLFIYNKIKYKDRIILLYNINGYSKEDISNILNISIKSITNSLYRSKNKIKSYVSKKYENA